MLPLDEARPERNGVKALLAAVYHLITRYSRLAEWQIVDYVD